MRHEFRDFIRQGGGGTFAGGRRLPRKAIPGEAALRADFAARLDAAARDNARMILNALTPPDTAPCVTPADLADLSALREEALRHWDLRLAAIAADHATHPQRLRPAREAMEDRLLRAWGGAVNRIRQQELGIESYVWTTVGDGKVRPGHAVLHGRRFRWDDADAVHPGQEPGCRCIAVPVPPGVRAEVVPVQQPLAFPVPGPGIPGPTLPAGLRALTPAGAAALAAGALDWLRDRAELARVRAAAESLGLDTSTVEGLLAARAYVWGEYRAGSISDADWAGPSSRIVAQAIALNELANPGAAGRAEMGVGKDRAEIVAAVDTALRAFGAGRLGLPDGGWADGWVEVFPDLSGDNHRPGSLPGFTPEMREAFLLADQGPARGLAG